MMFRSAWAAGGFDFSPRDAGIKAANNDSRPGSMLSFEPSPRSPRIPLTPTSEGSIRRRRGLQEDVGVRAAGVGSGPMVDAS